MTKSPCLASQATADVTKAGNQEAALAAFFAPATYLKPQAAPHQTPPNTPVISTPKPRQFKPYGILPPSTSYEMAKLWREIVGAVAGYLECSEAEHQGLADELAVQAPSFLRAVLMLAYAHDLAITHSPQFKRLMGTDAGAGLL
ncbi:MAG: hypothetical protein NT086_08050 [Proteobacteria bacterium]|nr:hypothetical protein [Pseudomonadota bacterium]